MGAEERLEYLRGEIQAERISYGEIAELQDLAWAIDPGDVELLSWAGVPEDCEDEAGWRILPPEGLGLRGVEDPEESVVDDHCEICEQYESECQCEDEDEEPVTLLVDLIGLAEGHGSVVLLRGEVDTGTEVLIAAEPRLAQAALAALDDGAPVQVEVEPWQVWRVKT